MSNIAAGTTSGTALVSTGDTTGALQLQVNGTTPSVTLAANGSIGVGSTPGYGTNGQVLTSSGTGSAPTWTTVSAGLAAATQAEMEAATSNTVAATPLNLKGHPGVAKVWLKAARDGTAINASYNVTSITDNGTGDITVTIDTDFSSGNYSITTFGAGTGGTTALINQIYVQAAGSFSAYCTNGTFGFVDPQFAWFFACFGDQA
jgi:hypothetical protein